MRKLSQIKGEDAIEVIAEIIEPIANIATDPQVKPLFGGKKNSEDESNAAYFLRQMRAGVPTLLRTHKHDIMLIMAALEGKTVEVYRESVNLLTFPMQIFSLLADKEIVELFTLSELEETLKSLSSVSADV